MKKLAILLVFSMAIVGRNNDNAGMLNSRLKVGDKEFGQDHYLVYCSPEQLDCGLRHILIMKYSPLLILLLVHHYH